MPCWAGCLGTFTKDYPANGNRVRYGGLWKYVRNEKIYSCPSGVKYAQLHYSLNGYIGITHWILQKVKFGAETAGRSSKIMLFMQESPNNDGFCAWWTSDPPGNVHNGGTTLSYCDGHVSCKIKKQLEIEIDRGDWYPNSAYYLRKVQY